MRHVLLVHPVQGPPAPMLQVLLFKGVEKSGKKTQKVWKKERRDDFLSIEGSYTCCFFFGGEIEKKQKKSTIWKSDFFATWDCVKLTNYHISENTWALSLKFYRNKGVSSTSFQQNISDRTQLFIEIVKYLSKKSWPSKWLLRPPWIQKV